MRIAHLGPTALPVLHSQGGAVQRRMIELAAAQAAAGDDVRVFSAEGRDASTEHRGVRVEAVRVTTSRPWRDYEMLARARRRISVEPADVLHLHGVPDGARMSRTLRTPAVLSFDYFRFRGSNFFLGKRYYRRSLDKFAKLLAVSAACKEMAREFWGAPPLEMDVLPNGVNIEQFHPDPEARNSIRAELGLRDAFVVLYVGRVCDQKGTGALLDAWEQLGAVPGAQLLIAGPIDQFGKSGASEHVTRLRRLGGHYLGAVEERRLAAVYNGCDVFVMPTLRDEMFGMAALEAQACGKPVVASRLGGLVEAVSPMSGRFVTPGNATELATIIGSLRADARTRSAMSAAALTHAKQFVWPAIARGANAIYGSVLR